MSDLVPDAGGRLVSWGLNFDEDWQEGSLFAGNDVQVDGWLTTRTGVEIALGGDVVMKNTAGEETVRIEGETGRVLARTSPRVIDAEGTEVGPLVGFSGGWYDVVLEDGEQLAPASVHMENGGFSPVATRIVYTWHTGANCTGAAYPHYSGSFLRSGERSYSDLGSNGTYDVFRYVTIDVLSVTSHDGRCLSSVEERQVLQHTGALPAPTPVGPVHIGW